VEVVGGLVGYLEGFEVVVVVVVGSVEVDPLDFVAGDVEAVEAESHLEAGVVQEGDVAVCGAVVFVDFVGHGSQPERVLVEVDEALAEFPAALLDGGVGDRVVELDELEDAAQVGLPVEVDEVLADVVAFFDLVHAELAREFLECPLLGDQHLVALVDRSDLLVQLCDRGMVGFDLFRLVLQHLVFHLHLLDFLIQVFVDV